MDKAFDVKMTEKRCVHSDDRIKWNLSNPWSCSLPFVNSPFIYTMSNILRSKAIRPSLPSISTRAFLEFDTLHSLSSNAANAYASNPLFGTFRNDKFEWMSYEEFGRRVDVCRAVLKEVGEIVVVLHQLVPVVD